jgi:hypothetical protein
MDLGEKINLRGAVIVIPSTLETERYECNPLNATYHTQSDTVDH